ncbi:hypothetical protein KW782_01625 [Candidatus Parcubacteria bacterium]|nr:hypothetical protein [Candidatus Parcubacteria bacterium]
MTFWLLVFISSGAIIILFIGLKILQEKTGTMLFWPGARERLEKLLVQKKNQGLDHLDQSSLPSIFDVIRGLLYIPRALVRVTMSWLERRFHRLVSIVRGKQKIENRGEASYFLNDIGPSRDKFRR